MTQLLQFSNLLVVRDGFKFSIWLQLPSSLLLLLPIPFMVFLSLSLWTIAIAFSDSFLPFSFLSTFNSWTNSTRPAVICVLLAGCLLHAYTHTQESDASSDFYKYWLGKTPVPSPCYIASTHTHTQQQLYMHTVHKILTSPSPPSVVKLSVRFCQSFNKKLANLRRSTRPGRPFENDKPTEKHTQTTFCCFSPNSSSNTTWWWLKSFSVKAAQWTGRISIYSVSVRCRAWAYRFTFFFFFKF